MEKRTKLALVIIVALILLIIGLYFLLYPFLQPSANQQPPSLPTNVTPYVPPPTQTPTSTAATGTGIAPPTSDVLAALKNEAIETVERVGSGTSIDGFQGYNDVLLQMTPNGQSSLETQQQALVKAHPAGGPTFGLSTHATLATVTSGAAGDPTVVISVTAVQAEDNGNPGTPTKTTGKRVSVTFTKQSDGTYLIDSMAWTDVAI